MRSIRTLVAVVAATALLAVVIPTVSAGSAREFHLDKTCAEDLSEPLGYVCTVQHSDFKWMPPGTEVHYLSQAGNVVQAAIAIRNGRSSKEPASRASRSWRSSRDSRDGWNGFPPPPLSGRSRERLTAAG